MDPRDKPGGDEQLDSEDARNVSLKVAIVGRPNVGKSTLFNRLVGKKLAIVDDRPGVTRDRRYARGVLGDLDLTLIDTAGFEDVSDESLEARMRRQTELAVDEADVVLFVVDAREGVVALDDPIAVGRFAVEEIEFWRDAGLYYFVPCVAKEGTK